MNIANYDATLIGWQGSIHKMKVSLGAANLKYCSGTESRLSLINTSSWKITDDIYIFTTTIPTLAMDGKKVIGTAIACIDMDGYLQFTSNTSKYAAINPNGNTGYKILVTASNNNPLVSNHQKTDGFTNTSALSNRMYTITDMGNNFYPSGMKVRIYYTNSDSTTTTAALDSSIFNSSFHCSWFKYSGGNSHIDNVAAILANQTSTGITGALLLKPSSWGIENAVSYVEFSDIKSFSTFGYIAVRSASALPDTLARFSATTSNCTVNLVWQSTTEKNTSTYIVEHSSNRLVFNEVGSATCNNQANGWTYKFSVPLIIADNYFRIKIVTQDGRFIYSSILYVKGTMNCRTFSTVNVSPNPVTGILKVQGIKAGSHLVLVDVMGKSLFTTTAGGINQSINVSEYLKGMYILHVTEPNGTSTSIKVFKQ